MSDDRKHKVLIVFGDAAETVDTMYPYFRLIEGGYEPVLAAPEKREYQMVMHQVKPGWTITREWEGYTMPAAVAFKDVEPEAYLGIFFSGGRAPEYIRYDQDLLNATRAIHQAGKPIACVCHGIEILTAAGCIEGRQVTTVAKCALDAEQGGATYVDQAVVIAENIVTARTWHDNAPFMREFLAMLGA